MDVNWREIDANATQILREITVKDPCIAMANPEMVMAGKTGNQKQLQHQILNFSCKECEEHYYGESCDLMNCTHGTQDEFYQKCVCEKPYSGDFCDTLLTEDVYLFYNSKMVTAVSYLFRIQTFFIPFQIGPLGALTILPLFIIYYGCEFMAQKRQVKRIGEMMSDQNVTVDSQAVKNLLDD